MAERDAVSVEVKGLKEFRRDIRKLDAEVNKSLARDLREGGQEALEASRTAAPVLTGRLARSLRLSITARSVSIYSTEPYAPVVHWGGTIRPRGVPIEFPRSEFISREVEQRADDIAEHIADSVERAARASGWH